MTTHCTAGHNYYIIVQNGSVYRCWPYNNSGTELGSVSECRLDVLNTTICPKRICMTACDPIDVTIQNDDGSIDSGIFAVKPDSPTVPQMKHIKFQVMLLHACNYTCGYCIANSNTADIAADKKQWLSPDTWIKWWRWIGTRFDTASVLLAGGEPGIFPRFDEIVMAISELGGHNQLCTNLSIPRAMRPFIEGKALNWNVSATAHPCSPNFKINEFMSLACDMRDAMGDKFNIKFVNAEENNPFAARTLDTIRAAGFGVSVLDDMRPQRTKIQTNDNIRKVRVL